MRRRILAGPARCGFRNGISAAAQAERAQAWKFLCSWIELASVASPILGYGASTAQFGFRLDGDYVGRRTDRESFVT
jgi:hypothetical protein